MGSILPVRLLMSRVGGLLSPGPPGSFDGREYAVDDISDRPRSEREGK